MYRKLTFSFIILFPLLLNANTVMTTFFTDKVGRVYNQKDFKLKVFQTACKSSFFPSIALDKKGISSRKGIEHLQYIMRTEKVASSPFFMIPFERVLGLTFRFTSLDKGEILIPIHETVPLKTKTIFMYISGDHTLDTMSFVFKDVYQKKTYLKFSPFKATSFGFFVFPLPESLYKKKEPFILEGIVLKHHHTLNRRQNIILKLGEVHFSSYKSDRAKKVTEHMPIDIQILPQQIDVTALNNEGPSNIIFIPQNSPVWNEKQNLKLDFDHFTPSTIEIYSVLQARVQKSFVMRFRVPQSQDHLCIKLNLPSHLTYYTQNRYADNNVLVHGIKVIPIDPFSKDTPPLKLNKLLLTRDRF
jgi:hypothetical protein